MLMADMDAGERETIRSLNEWRVPHGTKLVELLPVLMRVSLDVALVEHADGKREIMLLECDPPDGVTVEAFLLEQIEAYKRGIEETRRFLAMAAPLLGHPPGFRPWRCPSCGAPFHDPQHACPACGATGDE